MLNTGMSRTAIGELTLYQVQLLCLPEEKLGGTTRAASPSEARAMVQGAKAKAKQIQDSRFQVFR